MHSSENILHRLSVDEANYSVDNFQLFIRSTVRKCRIWPALQPSVGQTVLPDKK